jgi:hypothetical protein
MANPSRKREFEEKLNDPEEASLLAEKLHRGFQGGTKAPKAGEEGSSPRGGKKSPGHNRRSIVPLPGVPRPETAEKIRKIVALRFSGMSDAAICKDFNHNNKYIYELEREYPEAFEHARSEQIQLVIRDYQDGLVAVAGAVGRLGLEATKTLSREMVNLKDGTPHSRIKAAEIIVKLLAGARMIPQQTAGEALAEGVISQVKDVLAKERESYIGVIDAEVVVEEEE